MVESEAFRALSGSALKILFHLTSVWARSGGIKAKTKLVATYEQLSRCWGMDEHTVARALRQLKALGFLEVTEEGCAGNADEHQPNLFRLTFLPAEGVAGTGSNEWRQIVPEDAKRIANEAQRTPGQGPRRVRRVTCVTDKSKIPLRSRHGFHCEKSAAEGVTSVTNVTDPPLWINHSIYRSRPKRPEGPTQQTASVTPAQTLDGDAPAPTARIGPGHCEACGAEIKTRRIDARFCSAVCRKRAQRRRDHQQRKSA
jgi:hypothetical protein